MRRRFRTGIALIIIAFFIMLLGASLWSYVVEVEEYDEYYDEYFYEYYRPNEDVGASFIVLSIFFIFPIGLITLGLGHSSDKKKLNKMSLLHF